MSKKTITKFFAFVISFAFVCLNFSGCLSSSSNGQTNKTADSDYRKPQIAGTIKSAEIAESSGLAASICQPGVLWTHNDSGDGAFLYAIDASGKALGVWRVTEAENKDWEDIAAFKTFEGECFLYVGDIGNNESKREDLKIYVIKEPTVSKESEKSSRKKPLATDAAKTIRFAYADGGRFDAETLMVHPQNGDVYVLTKRQDAPSGVYKLAADEYAAAAASADKTNKLKKIADITVPSIFPGFLTGGAISPDGKRLVVCDYFDAYETELPLLTKSFDEIWKQKFKVVNLGKREQGEAVSYSTDGKSIFATSEKKDSPIIEVKRK